MDLNKLEYVDKAKEVIEKKIRRDKKNDICLTTNQIRNILSMVNELYLMARRNQGEELGEDIRSHAQYIKMKIIYAAGRTSEVKDFVDKSNLIDYLDSVGKSKEKMILFCHYMEALVAYHKYCKED